MGLGRSPLVAIRVSRLKPRMVILNGPNQVDELAIELSKRENIILGISKKDNENKIKSIFSQL